MMNSLPAFLVFWGVWILIPIMVDGLDLLFHTLSVTLFKRRFERRELEDHELPYISVIIPAFNEQWTIDRCIDSLKVQDYPHDRLEVIVVDDGSTDHTAAYVQDHVDESNGNGNGNGRRNGNGNGNGNGRNGNGVKINGKFIPVGDFDGVVKLVSKGKSGKADALNTGIGIAHGDLIINIDSDVVLAPHTLRATAIEFASDPDLAAATGNIRVSWEIVDERDENGDLVLDEEGRPVTRDLSLGERWLAHSQFFEYLSAFSLGREAQDATRTMYTLAGAYSAFRRDVLLESMKYRRLTVSEDTDLTLDLQRGEGRVGFIRDALVYVEPLLDWDSVYSQRVRWHRGQMEVCAVHQDIVAHREFGPIGYFGLPKMLLVDHSMAFPRLVWVLLLPFLVWFGYSPTLIFWAIIIMYGFYVLIELVHALLEYFLVDGDTKPFVLEAIGYSFSMPLYRFVLFYFRLSGYLQAMLEPPEWTVQGPVESMRNGLNGAQTAVTSVLAGFAGGFASIVGTYFLVMEHLSSLRSVAYVASNWRRLGIQLGLFALLVFVLGAGVATALALGWGG